MKAFNGFHAVGVCLIASIVMPQFASADDKYLRPVFDRDRPEFSNRGAIRAGSVEIKPSLAVGGYYTDNVFASETQEESDLVALVSPSLALKSRWRDHRISGGIYARSTSYQDNSDEDTVDAGANLGLDYVITKGVRSNLYARTQRKHIDRGNPNDLNGNEPTVYYEHQLGAGIRRDRGRLNLGIMGDVTRQTYDDVGLPNGGVIQNNERDNYAYELTTRVGYRYNPNYTPYLEGKLLWETYDEDTGFARDSDGYEINAGTAISLTGKLLGEVYLGYYEQSYDRAGFETIDGVNFGGNLLWESTRISTLELSLDRSVEASIQSGVSGYTSTDFSARYEHELRRNILMALNLGYGQDDFGTAAGQADREDDIYIASLEGRYLFGRGFKLVGQYSYNQRDSNTNGFDFETNRALLSLAYSW